MKELRIRRRGRRTGGLPRGMRLRETGGCYETGCSSAFGPSPWRCRHSLADARSASERRRPPPWAGGTSNASFGNARVIPRGVARGPSLRVRVGPSLSLRLWPSLRQWLARFRLAQRGGRGGIRTAPTTTATAVAAGGIASTIRLICRRGAARILTRLPTSIRMGMRDYGRMSASRMATAQAITAATATLAGMASTAGIASMAARHGGFAGAHMGAFGATHFVPRIGGAHVSGMGTAHFAGGFHGGMGGAHNGGFGLRVH